jgi:ketosteroid isomerase-like protein
MMTGKEAARKSWTESFARPGFAISWKVNKVEASGGDLAYSVGAYEESVDDAKGKPISDRGKYVTIWKKQADGSWKVVLDAFNSDLPKPEAAKK